MKLRRRTLRRDSKGYFRPYIGWKITGDGKRIQHRFNLGTDEQEAYARYSAIQKLYSDQQVLGDGWTPLALQYAEELASGQKSVVWPHPAYPIDGFPEPYTRGLQACMEFVRRTLPSVTILPSDPEQYAKSVQANKDYVAKRLGKLHDELRAFGNLTQTDSFPAKLVAGTLHKALSAYAAMIERDGERLSSGVLKSYSRLRIARVKRLKEHHSDFPLHELTFDRCKEIVAYWSNRPLTQRGERCSRDNARHHITELYSFWKWLDGTHEFDWELPKGVLLLKRKVVKVEEDRKTGLVSKPIYSVPELALIAKHANQWERLALLVGLNAAMGAAELGRMVIGDVLLRHKHEHADRLKFSSTEDDCFIRMYRPKTDVFSEHLLWPETAELLRWAINRARSLGSDLIFCRDGTGNPLYSDDSANPQAGFANLWTRLLNRVCKHEGEDFRKLPFGTLRDTLPDTLRHTHSDELASLCLAHGKPVNGDSLLDCYGNKPFGRLHDAIRELRGTFKDVLIARI